MNMDLIDAVKDNNLERVRLLVQQGADKDQGDSNGRTPLWWASHQGRLDVAQYLVEQGAILDKADIFDTSPLYVAAAYVHLEVCRYLLEQGADRDKANINGLTPLHIAVNNGYLEITMLLMSYGADLNVRTKSGRLPIDLTDNEEIKQAIRDEPRRRLDEAPGKRATEEDRHPNAATLASEQQEVEGEEGLEQLNKRPRLNDAEAVAGVVATDEGTKVAEEDEDSEPSSDENDD